MQLKPIGKPSIVPKHFSIVYPLGPGTEHLFYSKSKNERSVRDVVAGARFSNFKSLLTHTSFDMHKCIYSKMFVRSERDVVAAARFSNFKLL